MPNWCMNSLMITGSKEVIDEIASTNLSLEKLVPVPEEIRGVGKYSDSKSESEKKALKDKYGSDNQFDWQVSNWGTKWDIEVEHLDVSKVGDDYYQISASFSSAWSPPVKAFETIFDNYNDRGIEIYMEYLESGCSFLGTVTGKDGEFEDDYREYSNNDELEEAVKDLDHALGSDELRCLKDSEE